MECGLVWCFCWCCLCVSGLLGVWFCCLCGCGCCVCGVWMDVFVVVCLWCVLSVGICGGLYCGGGVIWLLYVFYLGDCECGDYGYYDCVDV